MFGDRREFEDASHQSVKQGAGGDGRKGLVDAGRSLLVGEFDDVGRARIELAAIAGGLVLGGPSHRILPYEVRAPGVVAHDDDCAGVPLVTLFEKLTDVGQVTVGQGEVIDV
jgi:hypothetical protein